MSSIRATVSAARNGFPGYHLVDGSYLNYWDNDLKVPVTIDLDLGRTRIKDYTVSVSTDGAAWAEVKTAVLPSAKGIQFIDLGVAAARHARLTVDSIWAAPQAPSYVNKLGIDEMYVVGEHVTASGGPRA